jgi:hypothetical protein
MEWWFWCRCGFGESNSCGTTAMILASLPRRFGFGVSWHPDAFLILNFTFVGLQTTTIMIEMLNTCQRHIMSNQCKSGIMLRRSSIDPQTSTLKIVRSKEGRWVPFCQDVVVYCKSKWSSFTLTPLTPLTFV